VPRISFTRNIQRHVTCPAAQVSGRSLGEALGDYFSTHPQARSYILDDQGGLRRHVAVYVDGVLIQDRRRLSDRLTPQSEIHVFQALSGG
jgi:hypothetical protein